MEEGESAEEGLSGDDGHLGLLRGSIRSNGSLVVSRKLTQEIEEVAEFSEG